MSTTPRLLSAIFASATGSAVLVQNGDRITAALQRLFAQPNDNASAALQLVLERLDQRPQTVVVREGGGGAGRVVIAGACVAGLAVRVRGWPASAAALRAAAQTLNSAVKAVGERLEVVRETLSKRVDEVGEKVDDVGVEVGEVKAELREVHDDTTHLRVQQDHIARGVRGLCGVVSELMHGSPPTRAADDLRRFTVESTSKPLEAPPERTDESRLATTAARLAEALAAVDAIGSA